ncbi:nucleotidyltransferase [Bacidia gigantensis]|uniref:nucleotidyltransferase n=1 Tax=Bacidia gigantensis TaxID=2732470 RepID=UPI001D03D682|nr:nucleotidyltransferase [Bacidia gigantensis]KAG8530944.1 nucleotidyltransferase [Bacidia gigantensis]
MPPIPCTKCDSARAIIIRPKDGQKLCKSCFLNIFEAEIHETIIANSLFFPNERVAIGASGGKDSTVLASVLKTLNERHNYGLQLVLLSIDEGIKGYRDDSLETVKRNAIQYDMPLRIVGYSDLYGWTMDQVVEQIGKKGNCTYCGVFRRQALDRGAAKLGINHVVTGHNADDIAETVLMNLLRGDLPRLSRATSIVTASSASDIKRSKPLKYAYEKEIVMYAHYKGLDYFTTECIYSPEAFRGSARTLIKNLEQVRPTSILDIVRSGEDMARLVPEESLKKSDDRLNTIINGGASGEGGCRSSHEKDSGGDMADMEQKLSESEVTKSRELDFTLIGQRHQRQACKKPNDEVRRPMVQQVGKCQSCGYMSSQRICKACTLLEGLNKNRPKTMIIPTVEEISITQRRDRPNEQ